MSEHEDLQLKAAVRGFSSNILVKVVRVRDEICRVMEGGRQAFETRYRRIMLAGGRRDG
jgi:hypothetical protein